MLLGAIAFLLGCLMVYAHPALATLSISFGSFGLALVLCLLLPVPYKKYAYNGIFFALGYCWVMLTVEHYRGSQLASAVSGPPVVVTGYVASLVEQTKERTAFVFDLTQLAGQPQSGQLKLYWYNNQEALSPGELWQFLVKLKPPRGLINPYGFDYEKYLFAQRIIALGTIKKSAENKRLSVATSNYWLQQVRNNVKQQLATISSHPELSPLISALILGERSGVTTKQWSILQATGTSHLMAISGLHIGLIASIAYFLFYWLWSRSLTLLTLCPTPYSASVAALVAAIAYAGLAGFSLPTQRAIIMVAVVLGAFLVQRKSFGLQGFALALVVVLLIDPLVVLTQGFWLSFIAAAVLLVGIKTTIKNYVYSLLQAQIRIFIGLAPITLVFFHQLSISGLVINPLAIPWLGLVVLPLALASLVASYLSLVVGQWLYYLAVQGLQVLWWLLEWGAGQGWSVWQFSVTSGWIIIPSFMAAGLFVLVRTWALRGLALLFCCPLIISYFWPSTTSGLELWIFDVGQGLSVVMRLDNKVLIYDTGPRYATRDTGTDILLPFLMANRLRTIDLLVISHHDSDHSGGALALLKKLPVRELVASQPAPFADYGAKSCQRGQQWQWGEVGIRVLHPADQDTLVGNNRSCVLLIEYKGKRILLPGDIERPAEQIMLARSRDELVADILVAPHHGSLTSSTLAFVTAVAPTWVVYATGYLNRFHFPKPAVQARYQALGSQALNTAHSGAIRFLITAAGTIEVQQQRVVDQTIWRMTATDEK